MRIVAMWCVLAASAGAQTWKLDTTKSELVVKVWKVGAAAAFAHDHVVRATKFEASATLEDPLALEKLTLKASLTVAALVPDEPEMRKKYGVVGPLVPEGDVKKIRENLLGDEQLEAAKFPTINFTSTRVFREPSGVIECEGQLTMHGVTKEVVFPFNATASATALEGDAKFKVRTSDFGVKPYSTALGLIKNKDEVELVLHLVFSR